MQIDTDRLRLREFTSSDWPAVLAYQSDPSYLRFYPWEQRTESDVRDFVQRFIDWQGEEPRRRFQLAVTLRSSGALIGSAGVRVNDPEQREANIGYEFSNRHWGRGYATEATGGVLDFAFADLKLHRIWAHTLAENAGSIRVLQKLGLRQEAHEREKVWIKGRWRDNLTFAILDHEWNAIETKSNAG